MKVRMYPHVKELSSKASGIAQVVVHYSKHLPEFGIQLVGPKATSYDLDAGHAGAFPGAMVHHSHGLLWTGDKEYSDASYQVNKDLAEAIRKAREVTVPSAWVGETFQRDMRFSPHIVWHGVDWQDWQHDYDNAGYVLWGKNRTSDWLDPSAINGLALAFPNIEFVTTFSTRDAPKNVKNLGNHAIPHNEMKILVQNAAVVLSTDKETWGILPAEAMAAGIPVLSVDFGAVPDFMPHTIAGYCFQRANLDDAIAGLAYCLEHRDILGANGRELARELTWEKACEKVASIYYAALKIEEPTVSVIIPCYNYGNKLSDAVESALAQDYNLIKHIVIVDDGSNDGITSQVGNELEQRYEKVSYLQQGNSGVAEARNTGWLDTNTKYVCFLDADDRMEPRFISNLVPILERDTSLGIAYTGVRVPLLDGTEAMPWDWSGELGPKQFISDNPWPHEFDFDRQIERKNEIPTCCLVRRKALERVGGYRSRYCPLGAGTEDAEMWLRIGAYGWDMKYAEPEQGALFVHTHGEGYVSGNDDYHEVDWTSWHPWAKDGQHPFASLATPRHIAHEVRSYDQPVVSVIIPVGPGHEKDVINALDSLEAQTVRNWEVIIAWDTGVVPLVLIEAYPYAKWIEADKEGAGAARNAGVSMARAPLIAFLDADDYYHPFFLEDAISSFSKTSMAVYTDFVSHIKKESHAELGGDIIQKKPDGTLLVSSKFADFDIVRATARPTGSRPYVWSAITILLPKIWHDEIGGFDESMESWEDCDYLLRLAWSGKQFYRIERELWIYNFISGRRRVAQTGKKAELMAYLQAKYDKVFRNGHGL